GQLMRPEKSSVKKSDPCGLPLCGRQFVVRSGLAGGRNRLLVYGHGARRCLAGRTAETAATDCRAELSRRRTAGPQGCHAGRFTSRDTAGPARDGWFAVESAR